MQSGFEILFANCPPFRFYAEQASGATTEELARAYGLSQTAIEERREAARLCFEKQVRVKIAHLPPGQAITPQDMPA